MAFVNSTLGKAYNAKLGFLYLHPVKTLDGIPAAPPVGWIPPKGPSSGSGKSNVPGIKFQDQSASSGKTVLPANILRNLNALMPVNIEDCNLLSCDIFPSQVLKNMEEVERGSTENNVNSKVGLSIYALLDQGSLPGDFISQAILLDLSRMSPNKGNFNLFVIDRPHSSPVCSGLDSKCSDFSAKFITLDVSFCKESNTSICDKFTFQSDFRILAETPFDMIIGRETIKKFRLGLVLPSHFIDEEVSQVIIRHYNPLLPGPITVDSLNSGEKDNNSQALLQNVGCSSRRCGCLSCPESLSHVVTNEEN